MTVDKKPLPQDLIDALLANYKKPEDLIGEEGLLKRGETGSGWASHTIQDTPEPIGEAASNALGLTPPR